MLARAGRRVVVLEKNGYVGGMGGTREILSGCRNEVGASCLFPLADEVLEALDLEGSGAELVDLPVMAVNLPGPGGRPLLFYKSPLQQLAHVLVDHGPSALVGFVRLLRFCRYPARVMDRFTAGRLPLSMDGLLAEAPSAAARASHPPQPARRIRAYDPHSGDCRMPPRGAMQICRRTLNGGALCEARRDR